MPTLPFESMRKAVEVAVADEVATAKSGVACVEVPLMERLAKGVEVPRPLRLANVAGKIFPELCKN